MDRQRKRSPVTESEYRARLRLPDAIERAEKRLEHLYRQAARWDMKHLLTDKNLLNQAWEAEIHNARIDGANR